MSKELEATKLKPYSKEEREYAINVIKYTVSENEYLKTELLGLSQELNVKNKALKIMKSHRPTFANNLGMCNSKEGIRYSIVINGLTQEEFDLLKEIFE